MKVKLRKARRDVGLSASQVGRELDISRSSVSAWENPNKKSLPSKENLKKLANLYSTTVDALVGHAASNIKATSDMIGVVPVLSFDQIGVEVNLQNLQYIFCPAGFSDKTYALIVQGMSMVSDNPQVRSYPEGCYIYCDPISDSEATSGQKVIARLSSGTRVFKQYVNEDGQRWLRALNPEYPAIHEPFVIESVITGQFIPD